MRIVLRLSPRRHLPVGLRGAGRWATESDGDGVQVAAAFYPLAYVAERVAGDATSTT